MYRHERFEELLHGKRILIAGYGREGQSTHTLLQRFVPADHITVACNDDEIFAALAQSPAFDLIIKSPGIPTMKFEGRCPLGTVSSQTDLFMQVYGDITIGVTGTKGKSTTTSLIHHVLSQCMGQQHKVLLAGNIGIPLFNIAQQLDEHTTVVAELSCHQLENIHRAPHIGVILNLFQEHLDHYHNYQGYQMAKMQLMLRQQADDHCFYCTDSHDLAHIVESFRPSVVSTLHPYSLHDARQAGTDTLPTTLKGDHNASNIFVAKQVCALLGINDSQFSSALASFHGLPHRLELVGTYHDITFYNDSISTIPQATIAAIEALKDVETLILGGYDRGIDYSPLVTLLVSASSSLRNIAFVGEAGRRILHILNSKFSTLRKASEEGKSQDLHYSEPKQCLEEILNSQFSILNSQIPFRLLQSDDYPAIVDWCFNVTSPGKICLLSPAAASYDSFKNFEQRGDTFKQLVRQHS